MTLGERIKLKRTELGLSVDKVANQLGVSRATIYRYESSDIENMGVDKLTPLAKALKTTPFYLLGLDQDDSVKPYASGRMVPVVGNIRASLPALAEENIVDYQYADVEDDAGYFYFRVRGDGMKGAYIFDGSLVLIRQQSDAKNGQIVACFVGSGEAALKRFSRKNDTIVLLSENPEFEPHIVPASDFESGEAKILGVAVEVRTKL